MPLTSEDQAKYRSLYFTTAKPYIKDIKDALDLFLQGNNDDIKLDTAHRGAHSLKSQSQMMGFLQISSVSEVLEHIFKAVVDKTLTFSPEILQAMKNAVVKIEDAVVKLENNEQEPDLQAEKETLINVSHV